jgi:carbon-monoxide dehydrogenase large subunit
MPYKTPLVFTYDTGRFAENLDRTMKLADWTGFEARRRQAAQRGMLRGIGISNTIEQAADPTYETAEIRFDPLGGMTFVTGSISHGQGHATIQTQMLVDRLGVDPDRIKFIAGDTDAVAFGMGTGGSRSTTMSGGAIVAVSDKIIAKGRKLAAHLLEASEGDVEFKAASPSPAPTAPRAFTRWQRRRSNWTSCRSVWNPASMRPPPIVPAVAISPMVATSARSRSIPRPAARR